MNFTIKQLNIFAPSEKAYICAPPSPLRTFYVMKYKVCIIMYNYTYILTCITIPMQVQTLRRMYACFEVSIVLLGVVVGGVGIRVCACAPFKYLKGTWTPSYSEILYPPLQIFRFKQNARGYCFV